MSGKGDQVSDQDLECHGKDLILHKAVYEAKNCFDQAGLKVMTEKSFCHVPVFPKE